jgi:hypothetical protein
VRYSRCTLRDIRRSPPNRMENTTTMAVRSNNLPFAEYCRLAKEDTWGVIKIKNVILHHLVLVLIVSFHANTRCFRQNKSRFHPFDSSTMRIDNYTVRKYRSGLVVPLSSMGRT